MNDLKRKIEGILGMSAIGDAMGAATENLSFKQIRKIFNGEVATFLKPNETAFALGNEAGEITDDFSQIYFLSEAIFKNNGKLDKEVVIEAILNWSQVPKYFNRFAGPTTRTAIAMYQDPNREMKALPGAVTVDYASKATNGSAMKIAPAGILNPNNIEGAIQDAITIAQVTHDNSLAIAGACAVAVCASVSLGEYATVESMLSAGYYGALRGEEIGKKVSREVAGASITKRIKLAIDIVEGCGTKEEKLLLLSEVIGSGLHISEAVPCAFGIIALNKKNPLQALIDAVNIGYDTDTIATIVGTMVGAFVDFEDKKFIELYKKVQDANHIDIEKMAEKYVSVVKKGEGK